MSLSEEDAKLGAEKALTDVTHEHGAEVGGAVNLAVHGLYGFE